MSNPENLGFLKKNACQVMIFVYISVVPELGGPGGHWPPQYLADQLTLFQPGEGRLSPPITNGPPKVFHLPVSLK